MNFKACGSASSLSHQVGERRTPMPPFERVHTVTNFYDGPQGGIADFQGQPHAYASIFDNSTGYGPTFLLMPIDEELFRLAIEDWGIWLRWEAAFHGGQTPMETHPALPAERARHEELKRLIGDRLVPVASRSQRAQAEFRAIEGTRELEVRWTVVSE